MKKVLNKQIVLVSEHAMLSYDRIQCSKYLQSRLMVHDIWLMELIETAIKRVR